MQQQYNYELQNNQLTSWKSADKPEFLHSDIIESPEFIFFSSFKLSIRKSSIKIMFLMFQDATNFLNMNR